MLENLFRLIKEQGRESVTDHAEVPYELNINVLAYTSCLVAGTLQSTWATGRMVGTAAFSNRMFRADKEQHDGAKQSEQLCKRDYR